MLTQKQHRLLKYLIEIQTQKGITPSFDEMRKATGAASKSGVHRLVAALEERGYVRKMPNRARAIEILRYPTGGMQPETPEAPETNVTSVDFRPEHNIDGAEAEAESVSKANGIMELPLLGKIAAGTPIEALSDPSSYVPVPETMVAGGEYFALEIVGDSMIEAGIHEGDMVIIKRTNVANTGDIVVALIENHEATLKTLRRGEAGRIALEAANPNYQTRYFEADKIRIQGRLTGLIRHY